MRVTVDLHSGIAREHVSVVQVTQDAGHPGPDLMAALTSADLYAAADALDQLTDQMGNHPENGWTAADVRREAAYLARIEHDHR